MHSPRQRAAHRVLRLFTTSHDYSYIEETHGSRAVPSRTWIGRGYLCTVTRTTASARVVQSIQDDITSGRLKAGDRLPTRRELCERYGIAAMTAAKVVRTLAEQGFVVSDVGRGVFVTETAGTRRPAEAPDRLASLEERVRVLEERLDKLDPSE